MNPDDLTLLPASCLRHLMDNGEVSAVEIAEDCIAKIESHNDLLNAVVTLSETVLDDAQAAQERLQRARQTGARGGDKSPEDPGLLCGIPAGIKDVTPVRGLRHTYGSPLYADNLAEQDALVVQRLRKAGAVIVGKTNTPEFATGGNTFNEVFGVTRNPWNPECSAGGSTGGGAAGLASGMIALAEGTDLGGSLRIPASFCGVVGIRPSPGLVPTWPSAYPWDTMQVTGGMARTAEDVAMYLQATAGPSSRAPVGQSATGRDFPAAVRAGPHEALRLAYCADIASIGIDEGVESVCRAAAESLATSGHETEIIELDLSSAWEAFLTIRGFWMVAQQHSRLALLERFGANLGGNVEFGLKVSTEQLGVAEQERGRLWDRFHAFFERFDLLLTPTMAIPPFPAEQSYPSSIGERKMRTYVDWFAPTFLLSLTGLPVASVPAGLDTEGLPVGLQIVGRPRGEESVLALAGLLQDLCPIGLPDTRPKLGVPG